MPSCLPDVPSILGVPARSLVHFLEIHFVRGRRLIYRLEFLAAGPAVRDWVGEGHPVCDVSVAADCSPLAQQLQSVFLHHHALFESRERPSKAYSCPVVLLAMTAVEIPWPAC